MIATYRTLTKRPTDQSRKRGTLESDLILSTFADAHLGTMTPQLLQQYDLFLDENDWDIYYWATQEPEPAAASDGHVHTKKPGVHYEAPEKDVDDAKDEGVKDVDMGSQPHPRPGEWAQTVGTFKPAYRPVPKRWDGSEILEMLRAHVKDRGMGKGGMAFMPNLR
jgi:succinate dehydrogenase flavin-adding protein (antitoxin of CptAB toxin-antitoxin module)